MTIYELLARVEKLEPTIKSTSGASYDKLLAKLREIKEQEDERQFYYVIASMAVDLLECFPVVEK